MLSSADIGKIAKEVAAKRFPPESIDDVSSQETVDADGHDALRITITLKAKTAQQLKGDDVLDTLVDIQSRLAQKGENRLSIVEYQEAGEILEADDIGDTKS
jgi:hypothetical protein